MAQPQTLMWNTSARDNATRGGGGTTVASSVETATSLGGETIRLSSADAGESSLVGGPRIGERGGDAARSSVGQRSSSTDV